MKNSLKYFLAVPFLTGLILTGCQTSAEKVQDKRENVTEAKQELNEEKAEAYAEQQQEANEAAYKSYKIESDARIDANETMISDIKADMRKAGKKMDKEYEQQIDALEKKNKDLRQRLNAYNARKQNDWDSFKREFDHDMNELGTAMNGITVNNKK
ncbi:MAG: hypothetical protein IT270_04130 [Saprospiraceae bacterium]|nr:hypothetical protein [Saprospiraceae bacterium]